MRVWDTSCPDWEQRLLDGRTLVPTLPLYDDEAAKAVRVFKRLRIPDVIGTPTIGEAAGAWLFPIVEAVFGSYDPDTHRRALQEFFWLIPKKNWKALALDTPVATPTGWCPIGGLRVGDQVMDADGKPTRVLGKSEVFIGRPCFEVEFSTGERVVCDADHLWVTDAHKDRDSARQRGQIGTRSMPSAKTTAQIAATLQVKSGGLVIRNHRCALSGSLDLPSGDLPIPPYVLGAWLGDGGTGKAEITTGLAEADGMVLRLVANGQPAYVQARYETKGSCTVALVERGVHSSVPLAYRFRTEAIGLGVFRDKHIPQIYLRGSVAQRLELLRGLMDTDGSISPKGQASFYTTKPRLRDDVRELVNSLGLKSSASEFRARVNGKDCGPYWAIQFWPCADMPVFSMAQKVMRQRARPKTLTRSETRQIVAVRPVPSVPTQCIAVESATRQFLVTRSLIPTHNTGASACIMLTALIMNRRPEAELTLIAPTKDVADRAFSHVDGSIRLDPSLTKLFHRQNHIRTITHRVSGAKLQVKAADTDIVTGIRSAYIMIDETHVFANKSSAYAIFVEIRGALAARPDGFLIQITTQSKSPPVGVFRTELHNARDVRDGKLDLPLLPILYEYPARIANDGSWKDPKFWPMVNPNINKSVDEGFLTRELMKAEREGIQALGLFASQHFNIEIGISLRTDRWPGAEYWLNRGDPTLTYQEVLERSEVIVVGIDGGGLDDLFGLAILGRDKETKDWLLWSHAWCHDGVLTRRRSIAQHLRDFEQDGDLTIVMDIAEVEPEIINMIAEIKEKDLLGAVAADSEGPFGEFVDLLDQIEVTQENKLLVGVNQGIRLMRAIKTTERRLASGSMRHHGSRLMAWCVANLKIEATATALRATKANAGDAKIDPAMAMFDAVDIMIANPNPKQEPSYQMFFVG